MKATSHLEKVRAFYVMWVKKKTVWFLTFFDNVSFCVDFLVEWSSRRWRPNRYRHGATWKVSATTEGQKSKGSRDLKLSRCAFTSLQFSSVQFNSQLFKHLVGNETKHCWTVKAIFITSTFLKGTSHIPLCLSQIFWVTLYDNHH